MTAARRPPENDMTRGRSALEIENAWTQEPRWKGISRHYSAEDVARLRGTVHIEHTLALAHSRNRHRERLPQPMQPS